MYDIDWALRSNQVPWAETIALDSADDGSPLDLAGCTVTLDIRAGTSRGRGSVPAAWGSGYATGGNPSPVLTASTANGKVSVPEAGVVQFAFTRADMQTLAPGTYEVCLRIESASTPDTDGVELFIGTVPVMQG